jgi:hypothetical protein
MSTEILRPSAAGDETNLSLYPDSGEQNWQDVGEAVADDDATFVWTNSVAYLRDLYNLPSSSELGIINSITVYARCKAAETPTQSSAKIAVKTGGTTYESAEQTLTNDWALYSNPWTKNPLTGVAWTWDDINALQIGVALRRPIAGLGYGSYCTQVYVEINYTSPAGGSKGFIIG